MHKPDPVEAVLARLMPVGLSQEGQSGIESMLDELAGEAPAFDLVVTRGRTGKRWMVAGGIAAAGIAALLVFPMMPGTTQAHNLVATESAADESWLPEVVLLDESDRIESMTDEGWQEDFDGSSLRAMRLSLVQEDSLLDEETGIVMQVSQPREEILLMPVSTF